MTRNNSYTDHRYHGSTEGPRHGSLSDAWLFQKITANLNRREAVRLEGPGDAGDANRPGDRGMEVNRGLSDKNVPT